MQPQKFFCKYSQGDPTTKVLVLECFVLRSLRKLCISYKDLTE